ncbi:hypothetical protein F511_40737 [Dorcoceras hygrometricum]|uniref:Uncharacterized protein n=1 Tax=Dorcoceras hygrometricum TaxID=472368 RepID=A0A2Z7AWN7_9LAMI|nr:hypothetical protein F511_40737 [Dorcoceras hygrometricum]
MSLFDLQDVCIAIGSLTTLDLPMVVDLIGIYGLKGPYCMLTTTSWFLQALSVIPRGSWGDVARRFTMIRWGLIQHTQHQNLALQTAAPSSPSYRRRRPPPSPPPPPIAGICSDQLFEEFPSVLISSGLLVQADEGTLLPVVDLIRHNLPPPTVKSQSPCDSGWSQAPVASKEFSRSLLYQKWHLHLLATPTRFILPLSLPWTTQKMVAMFEALVASGLNGFLGCMSDIFESALIEFYHNASVRDDKVVSTVQGKLVEISEEIFAWTFQLPVEGLIDINEVPKDVIFDARTEFSFTGEQLTTSCKKRELKIEYRLLSDIVEKSITVKAGSFDADMVTPETRQARGYAVHICILLKNIPDLKLEDSEEFPPLKILTAKTVGRYIAINDKIAVDSVEGLAGKSQVKKTPVKGAASKKRPAVAIEEQVVKKKRTLKVKAAPSKAKLELVVKKKRTLKVKAAPSKAKLELVSVALDSEPIQTVDPTSSDDVNTIIETVLAESAQLDTDVGSPVVQKADEIEHWFDLSYEEFTTRQANKIVESVKVAKEIEMETVLADPVITKSDDILVELRQSGPRPDSRLLRQTALEVLTRSARSDSPRKVGRKQVSGDNGAATAAARGGDGGGGVRVRREAACAF